MKRAPTLRLAGLGALLCLAVTIVSWVIHRAPPRPSAKSTDVPQRTEVIAALAAPARLEPTTAEFDHIPPMQAGAEDSTEHGPRRPHPITPTRLRIYRENNLIGSMNRAMDLGRYEELRTLNATYREEYPEDEHVLQQGYELIANCQEELTDERRAEARAFWKKHRSSQLRRFIRRHCRL